MQDNKYGEALKAAMQAAGFTGKALAVAVGVKPAVVGNWVARGVSAAHGSAVGQLLGIDPAKISPVINEAAAGISNSVRIDTIERTMQIEVADNGMAPTIIKGDLVVIDLLRDAEPDDIVGAHVNGVAIIRRYDLAGNAPRLVPDNARFPVIEEGFAVLGVAHNFTRLFS